MACSCGWCSPTEAPVLAQRAARWSAKGVRPAPEEDSERQRALASDISTLVAVAMPNDVHAAADLATGAGEEQRLRLVIEATPNALIMADGRGVITLVNSQAERLFGYLRSEMLGKPVELLIPERFRNAHRTDEHTSELQSLMSISYA